MRFEQLLRSLIGHQGPREIVHGDQAHGHVVERDGQFFRIAMREQVLIGALIMQQRFGETVLAMIDVANVVFQACQPACIAQLVECFLRALSESKRLVVTAQHDQGLNRGGERAGRAFFVLALVEEL